MQNFQIEITDTFGGEANYSWVRRYAYRAKSVQGAMQKLARDYGKGWRKEWDDGDTARYKLQGACICCFVTTQWEA
jgi:hypothetical protein